MSPFKGNSLSLLLLGSPLGAPLQRSPRFLAAAAATPAAAAATPAAAAVAVAAAAAETGSGPRNRSP